MATSKAKMNITDSRSSSLTLKRAKSRKSRCNVDLPKVVKQRGLYVERTKTSLQNMSNKSKSPPRRDQRSFLYTALTMLSKPSAATQFPDIETAVVQNPIEQATEAKIKRKVKPKVRTKSRESKDLAAVTMEVKRKFRSKILKEITDYGLDDDVKVLQPKREMVMTPSAYSADISKSSDIGNLEKSDENNKEVKDFDERLNEKGPDKKLYEFFVDVLENTFSVYNMNVNQNEMKQTNSVKFSEIEENVAEKLCIKPHESIETVEEIEKPDIDNFFITDDFIDPPEPKLRKLKVKTKSDPKRKVKDKSKKNDFLNILKEELSQTSEYKEPNNIYDALKQIARNKRKKITFEHVDNKGGFRSNTINKAIRKTKEIIKKPAISTVARPIKIVKDNNISDHSLKVYDFDRITVPRNVSKSDNVVLLTNHSAEELRTDFNPEVILRYSDSDSSLY